MNVTSVAVVDDDQMLLDALTVWLRDSRHLRLVAAARTVDELVATEPERADVVVLDLMLSDGSDAVTNVRRLVAHGRKVLVVSALPEARHGVDVTRAGAVGFLTKRSSLTALEDAVRVIAGGDTAHSRELAFAWSTDKRSDRPHLTAQERAVLMFYASGMTLTATARRAGIQPATAKKYLDNVKRKYGDAGRPTYTKLDMANRVREDALEPYR